MFLTQRLVPFVLLFWLTACQQEPVATPPRTGVLYQSDFSNGLDGWTANFVDYSTLQQDMQLRSEWTSLPAPLNTSRRSVLVSGINRSDDLFMYLTRKLTGLQPNTDYRLVFDIELASTYATNSAGIGGSPGSSVFLKAGAVSSEPQRQLTDTFYSLNIDKGNQAQGGRDALVLGTIGAGNDVNVYTLINRSNASTPQTVRTNAQGELWFVVGTDSGFEGTTTLYYSSVKVTAL